MKYTTYTRDTFKLGVKANPNNKMIPYYYRKKYGNPVTDFDVFIYEVRKIFPNAEKERVIDYLKNGNYSFCYDFGGLSFKNSSKSMHKQINKINMLAGKYRKNKGFNLG